MSHGSGSLSSGSQAMSVGHGEQSYALGRQYYDTVGAYLRLVRESSGSEGGSCFDLSRLVEGMRSVAIPVLCGCGGDICAGLQSVSRVGVGSTGFAEVLGELESVAAGVGVASAVEKGTLLGGRVQVGVDPVALGERVGAGASRCGESAECSGSVCGGTEQSAVCLGGVAARGRWYESNRKKKEKKRLLKRSVPEWRRSARPLVDGSGGCVSDESATGSVQTVDTRTGVEIEAAQTLAACRVAENRKREVEAKVAAKLAEHRLAALHDKDRTVVVQRLAAARYEQKINEAKAKSQASYKKCDESMKSLGSTGSAGEFALKQAVKEARDNAKTLKYVQEQADLFYQYATPEVRRMVAEMPEPEMEDEFDVFGDCPSDYNEEQREAYYDDLNRRNAEHGLVGSSPVPPRRELTPEEFLKIEEEVRALSANQV